MTKKEEEKKTHTLKAEPGKFTVTGRALRIPVKGKTKKNNLQKKTTKYPNPLADALLGIFPKEKAIIPKDHIEKVKKAFGEDFDQVAGVIKDGAGRRVELSASEGHLFDVLLAMLKEKSLEAGNPEELTFYGGTELTAITIDAGEITQRRLATPGIEATEYEVTKRYTGKQEIGGKDTENVGKLLKALGEKKVWINLPVAPITQKGVKKYERIWIEEPLITLTEKKKGKEVLDPETGELKQEKTTLYGITFHPVVKSQQTGGFFRLPEPTTEGRTKEKAFQLFQKSLYRAYSYAIKKKGCTHEISEEKLFSQCFPEDLKQHRKKRIEEKLKRYIKELQEDGLLLEAIPREGAKGVIWCFTFNPDHQKTFLN